MKVETLIFQNSCHELISKMIVNIGDNSILESDNENRKIIERCELTKVILIEYNWPDNKEIKYCLIY